MKSELLKKSSTSVFPKYLWHVTDKKHVESIRTNGIQTGQQRTSEGGEIRGVYLTDVPEEVFKGGDFNPRDPWVLKVDVTGLDLHFDPEFYDDYEPEDIAEAVANQEVALHVYSTIPIPPERIVGATAYSQFRMGSKNASAGLIKYKVEFIRKKKYVDQDIWVSDVPDGRDWTHHEQEILKELEKICGSVVDDEIWSLDWAGLGGEEPSEGTVYSQHTGEDVAYIIYVGLDAMSEEDILKRNQLLKLKHSSSSRKTWQVWPWGNDTKPQFEPFYIHTDTDNKEEALVEICKHFSWDPNEFWADYKVDEEGGTGQMQDSYDHAVYWVEVMKEDIPEMSDEDVINRYKKSSDEDQMRTYKVFKVDVEVGGTEEEPSFFVSSTYPPGQDAGPLLEQILVKSGAPAGSVNDYYIDWEPVNEWHGPEDRRWGVVVEGHGRRSSELFYLEEVEKTDIMDLPDDAILERRKRSSSETLKNMDWDHLWMPGIVLNVEEYSILEIMKAISKVAPAKYKARLMQCQITNGTDARLNEERVWFVTSSTGDERMVLREVSPLDLSDDEILERRKRGSEEKKWYRVMPIVDGGHTEDEGSWVLHGTRDEVARQVREKTPGVSVEWAEPGEELWGWEANELPIGIAYIEGGDLWWMGELNQEQIKNVREDIVSMDDDSVLERHKLKRGSDETLEVLKVVFPRGGGEGVVQVTVGSDNELIEAVRELQGISREVVDYQGWNVWLVKDMQAEPDWINGEYGRLLQKVPPGAEYLIVYPGVGYTGVVAGVYEASPLDLDDEAILTRRK